MSQAVRHSRPLPGGRGHGGRGRGHGSARSSQGGHRSNQASSTSRHTKFQGSCEALKDHYFDCSDHRQADRFANTLKRISEYVGTEFKNGGDICSSMINETKFVVPRPTLPTPADPNALTAEERVEERLYEKRLDALVKQEGTLDDNIQRLYSLVLGQCTDLLQTKLKQQNGWKKVSEDQDGIALLKLIKTTVHKFDDQKFTPLAHYRAKAAVYAVRQGNLSNDEYLKKFNNLVDVAQSYDGHFHDQAMMGVVMDKDHPGVLWKDLDPAEQTAVNVKAHELFCATMFLSQCDKRRYGKLLEELENGYTRGQDGYPKDMVTAFKMINEYKNWQPTKAAEVTGTAFATSGKKSKSGGGSSNTDWHKDAICHGCGEKGHIRPHCPNGGKKDDEDSKDSKDSKKGNSCLKKSVSFAQEGDQAGEDGFGFCNVDSDDPQLRDMILLDNQSTVDIFCNRRLVQKVWKSDESMTVKGNGGSLTTNFKATVRNYGEVWFDERAITNILCLKNVRKKLPVSYSCYPDSTFYVEKEDGTSIDFVMHPDGLHYHHTKRQELAMVNTVAGNEEGYTKRQLKEAKAARELQAIVGSPSTADLKAMLNSNQIANCPVTSEHVDRAETIYGPSIANLKGKTVRKKPESVVSDYVAVPKEIVEANKDVAIAADIFFVNKNAFLATISEKIKLTTAKYIPNRSSELLLKGMKEVKGLYSSRGFNLRTALMDGEFEVLNSALQELGITLNTTAANEHSPFIERQIRVIKERVRATKHTLPFKVIPLIMLVELVYFCIFWLNAFPPKSGVSSTHSPCKIITGQQVEFKKHCKLPFGAYVQTHEEPTPSNTQQARTIGAIALGPTGNLQGSYKFLNLRSGKRITRRNWTQLPMPQEVIDRVNQLGVNDGQPEVLTFYNSKGDLIGDSDPDALADEINGDASKEVSVDEVAGDLGEETSSNDDGAEESDPTADDETVLEDTEEVVLEESTTEEVAETVEETSTAEIEGVPMSEEEIPTLRRSTRERNAPNRLVPTMEGKSHSESNNAALTTVHPDAHLNHSFLTMGGTVLTQLSLKAGLKKWKERGETAVSKELEQLHNRESFLPVHMKDLTPAQRKQVLESYLFLAEKRDKTIKGRMVAGGNKQRGFINKEDATSPTAALESVLLTSVIDAHEGRDVAVVDVPNAFVQTKLEEESDKAIVRLRGRLAELLVEVDPERYGPYAFKDSKGVTILLVQILNALYGIMRAALLYYQKFVKDIKSIGFKLNPYDPCVANKLVKGKMLTIVWHVDDLKVSHFFEDVVTRMISWLKKCYEKIFPDGSGKMKVSRGKVHDYLGMTLDFSTPGEVKVTMLDYIKDMINEFNQHDSTGKISKIPASEDLFKVDPDSPLLNAELAGVFHSIIAKGLFLIKRARPDGAVPIAFLSTRVKNPTDQDWKKGRKFIRYLQGCPELPLILKADNLAVLKWWVDGSHAVHADLRGQSGGCMMMDKGAIISGSTRQKINTRSSTETELVAADDFMPMLLWTRYFLEGQGYGSVDTVLYQDNQSAILLEKNGRLSSSKRTKHLNIRYFFITDRINDGDLKVEYCPSTEMVADFFTKPLQGKMFLKFRKMVMNHD